MSNERNWFFVLLRRRCFHIHFSLFFLLLFHFSANFVTKTSDKFRFQSQRSLSLINVGVMISSKFKLYAVLIKWGSRVYSLFVERQEIVNYWDFPSKISRNCHKWLVPKITRHDKWEIFVEMSHRGGLVFCLFCWMDCACSLFPATTIQLFSPSSSSHTFWSCLEVFSLFNNIYNFRQNELQQISAHAFCRWDDKFTQKGNCGSPNNFWMCTESRPTVLADTSEEWNLYLSWSNHLVTSFILEVDVWGFLKHQNKTSDTHYQQVERVFLPRPCLASQFELYEKVFWAVVWIAGC